MIYIAVLTALHLIPTGESLALDQVQLYSFRADYLAHTLVFMPYMLLVWLHLKEKRITGRARLRAALPWFAGGLALASVLEGVHYWWPYRSFNITDLLFGLLGICAGAAIFALRHRLDKN